MTAQLRPMRWWDLAAVQGFEDDLFPDPWTPSTFWSELAGVPDTRYYVVAESGGAVVGYAGLFVAGSDADVQTVGVTRALQGTGLGALLLDDLLAEAVRRECSRVTLEVREDNQRAQGLYAARGFERIGVRRGYYPSDGADAAVMQVRLRGASARIGPAS